VLKPNVNCVTLATGCSTPQVYNVNWVVPPAWYIPQKWWGHVPPSSYGGAALGHCHLLETIYVGVVHLIRMAAGATGCVQKRFTCLSITLLAMQEAVAAFSCLHTCLQLWLEEIVVVVSGKRPPGE